MEAYWKNVFWGKTLESPVTFHKTTVAESGSYFPDRPVFAKFFFTLFIHCWQYLTASTNTVLKKIVNEFAQDFDKLDFISHFAQWIGEGSHSLNFHLSKWKVNALASVLQSYALLIKDLLKMATLMWRHEGSKLMQTKVDSRIIVK